MPDPLVTTAHHPVYLARQRRLRSVMTELQIPALLITDPIRIRYACGARNMQVWNSREATRALLMFAEGPAILYEYPGYEHLAQGLPTLDEIRATPPIPYIGADLDIQDASGNWADEIASLAQQHAGRGATVAIDRFRLNVIDALRAAGLVLVDAEQVTAVARTIKLDIELPLVRQSIRAVSEATRRMHEAIAPGMTENEIWANFHHGFIEKDAEYATTRLLVGSDRSFPYFRESGPYPVNAGDLVLFDTDVIGLDGYSVDFSRTFVCGDRHRNPRQKQLYQLAYEQLRHNIDLFQGHASFRDIAERAWPVPDRYRPTSYYVIAHGIGMSGEYPAIPHLFDADTKAPTGRLEPGMTMCVESYIGDSESGEGVKLEEHLLITDRAPVALSDYPFEEQLL